jgi:ATP adenylyltransferase
MHQLHAPWRMEYVGLPQPPGCLFCRVWEAPAEQDKDNLVIHRTPHALVMLNRFPYNAGHLMVAPRSHVPNLTDLEDEDLMALMRLVRISLQALGVAFAPEGYNVGTNIGRAAGAGIPDHVHMHLVPRWNGDTNFMPVLGEVKVLNEHLASTWERLRAAFQNLHIG